MKKQMQLEAMFSALMILVSTFLGLFDSTGVVAHIVISVAGILVLAAYTAATKKYWKLPALEIVMRACYGLALVSGIVTMNVAVPAIAIAHKVLATLFLVLLVALLIYKTVVYEKSKK